MQIDSTQRPLSTASTDIEVTMQSSARPSANVHSESARQMLDVKSSLNPNIGPFMPSMGKPICPSSWGPSPGHPQAISNHPPLIFLLHRYQECHQLSVDKCTSQVQHQARPRVFHHKFKGANHH